MALPVAEPYQPGSPIDGLEYIATWIAQTASSISEMPSDARFHRYQTCLNDLDLDRVFPAFAVDASLAKVRAFDPGARAISYAELLQCPHLYEPLLQQRRRNAKGRWRPEPHLMVEYCLGCHRRVIKDGCKELLECLRRNENARFVVTEVAGRDWSRAIYDMHLVCGCDHQPVRG